MSNATKTVVSKSVITLDSVEVNEFSKAGTATAQIRQVISTTSWYPAKKVDTDMQNNLFAAEAFGAAFEEKPFKSTENRMAWIPVPLKMSVEEVQLGINAANVSEGCIYRTLSHEPILTKDQKYSIGIGQRSKEDYAAKQAMRYPETPQTIANGTAGELILFNGKVQYRRTFYWASPKEDVDLRSTSEIYTSPELQAELTGAATAFAGQEVE